VTQMPSMHPMARAALVAVLKKHGVTYEKLVRRKAGGLRGRGGHRAPGSEARIRWEAMAALRNIQRADGRHLLTLTRIGKILDGMDHTSVLHGLRRWEEITQAEIVHSQTVFCGFPQAALSEPNEAPQSHSMHSHSSQEQRPCLT
jgi:hypothetical protein